jgi:hypothetical protein
MAGRVPRRFQDNKIAYAIALSYRPNDTVTVEVDKRNVTLASPEDGPRSAGSDLA